MATIRKRLAEAREAAVLEESGEDEGVEVVPRPTNDIKKKKKKRKKRRKWVRAPDMTELSLPKPAARLATDLDLSGSAVLGTRQTAHALSSVGSVVLPAGALAEANAQTIKGFKPRRLKPDDARVAQYRSFYATQVYDERNELLWYV
jgi:hypothetical protein